MRCARCHAVVPPGAGACPLDGGAPLTTVTEALERGPIPLSQVARVVDLALAQVAARHAAGQAHGGIGPDAVCFAQVGDALTVVVVDAPPGAGAYAAPEGFVSAPGDVHAFGVLMHHMITGRRPWPGPLPALTGDRLQDVPEALDALIQAMVAREPSARPSPLEAVRAQLENLELDSTLTGARLAAARAELLGGAAPPPARQLYLTPSHGLDVDPTGDTFIRGRAELAADVAAVEAEAFADTLLRRRSDLEAAARPAEEAQATLLDLAPPSLPARPAAPRPTGLDVETQLLMESVAAPESRLRWVVVGVAGGLVVGGLAAAVALALL